MGVEVGDVDGNGELAADPDCVGIPDENPLFLLSPALVLRESLGASHELNIRQKIVANKILDITKLHPSLYSIILSGYRG